MCDDLKKKIQWDNNRLKRREKLVSEIQKIGKSIKLLESNIIDVTKIIFFKLNLLQEIDETSIILSNKYM